MIRIAKTAAGVATLVLGIPACATMQVDQTTTTLSDSSTLTFTRMKDENPVGMDVSSLVVTHCIPEKHPCDIINTSQGFQQGAVRSLFNSAGTAAVIGAGFVAGEYVRRPDRTNITTGGGSASSSSNGNSIDFDHDHHHH